MKERFKKLEIHIEETPIDKLLSNQNIEITIVNQEPDDLSKRKRFYADSTEKKLKKELYHSRSLSCKKLMRKTNTQNSP